MTRRHNRQFYLDDDLERCYGKSTQEQFKGIRCSNWGKPDENGMYWCHHHKDQAAEGIYYAIERAKVKAGQA